MFILNNTVQQNHMEDIEFQRRFYIIIPKSLMSAPKDETNPCKNIIVKTFLTIIN